MSSPIAGAGNNQFFYEAGAALGGRLTGLRLAALVPETLPAGDALAGETIGVEQQPVPAAAQHEGVDAVAVTLLAAAWSTPTKLVLPQFRFQPEHDRLLRLKSRVASNPSTAIRFGDAIQGAVSRLANVPNSGRPGRIKGTRELVVNGTPYVPSKEGPRPAPTR